MKFILFFIFTYVGVESGQLSLALLRHNANYLSLEFYTGDAWTRVSGILYALFVTMITYINTRKFNSVLNNKLIRNMNLVSFVMYSLLLLEYAYLLLFSKTVERLEARGLIASILVLIFIALIFNLVMIKRYPRLK
jgi:hypothetical protein